MNGRTLKGAGLVAMVLALTACATTAPPQDVSILETMQGQAYSQPASCKALNMATFCTSGGLRSRQDQECTCVDKRALTDPDFR